MTKKRGYMDAYIPEDVNLLQKAVSEIQFNADKL